MKNLIIGIILILLLASQAQAYEVRTIAKKEMIESQYGYLGDWLGFGDRLYKVTYVGGQKELVIVRGSMLSPAMITEGLGATVWCTEGKTCNINFRAKAPNLERFTGGTGYATHKFELYDDTGSYPFVVATRTPNPLIDSQVPTTYGKLETFTLPDSYLAGKKYMFIKEYVQDRTTGQWIAGADSYSSESRHDVIYTTQVQATPTSTPTSIKLKIESSPQGATVTSDGGSVYLGTTPFDLTLGTGESKIITIKKSGYIEQAKGVSTSTTSPLLVVLNSITAAPSTPVPTYTPEPTPAQTTTTTATATTTGTPSVTVTTATATTTEIPSVTVTSSVDVTYGAGSKDITYQGVDIRSEDGTYYVGDIPHDSIAEAKNTIDEMIAGKEEKSILNQINTPAGWIGGLIVLVIAAYLLLPEPNKGKKKK